MAWGEGTVACLTGAARADKTRCGSSPQARCRLCGTLAAGGGATEMAASWAAKCSVAAPADTRAALSRSWDVAMWRRRCGRGIRPRGPQLAPHVAAFLHAGSVYAHGRLRLYMLMYRHAHVTVRIARHACDSGKECGARNLHGGKPGQFRRGARGGGHLGFCCFAARCDGAAIHDCQQWNELRQARRRSPAS